MITEHQIKMFPSFSKVSKDLLTKLLVQDVSIFIKLIIYLNKPKQRLGYGPDGIN